MSKQNRLDYNRENAEAYDSGKQTPKGKGEQPMKIGLPPKHSDEAHKAAVLVLAIDHAHDMLPVCEDEKEQTEDTFGSESIAYLISGCDEHGNDRTPESWDAVESLAYELICAHYGFTPVQH
jgi:hypothetical protein